MTPRGGTRYLTRSPEEMEAIGAALAASEPPSPDGPAVAFLEGDLGAGKTTLARGFLRRIGHAGTVRSPTYTLLERYALPALTVIHLDLYRLRDPSELEALGLRDYALPDHVWLIEWPERGEGGLPAPDVRLALRVEPNGHTVETRACTPLGETWLAGLAAGPAAARPPS